MEVLKITFAANQRKRFERAGRYLEIISSSAAITIDLYNRDGSDVAGAVDALSGLYMEGEFSSFNIFSATAQTIEILVTDGRGGSRRQPGNVTIVNRPEELTNTKAYFYGGGGIGPDAVKQCVITLKAVTKTVVVSSLQVSSPVAGAVVLAMSTSAGTASPGGGTCPNKFAFAPASSALFTAGTAAAFSSGALTAAEAPGYQQFGGKVTIMANQTYEMTFDEPIVLSPGNCLLLLGLDANRGLNMCAHFQEK